MDIFRAQDGKYSLAYCLNNLAKVVYSQGDLGRAALLTDEGVALLRELGARGDVALGHPSVGAIRFPGCYLGTVLQQRRKVRTSEAATSCTCAPKRA
jgi:hypothetical protein